LLLFHFPSGSRPLPFYVSFLSDRRLCGNYCKKIAEARTVLAFATSILIFLGHDAEKVAATLRKGSPSKWHTVFLLCCFQPCFEPSYITSGWIQFAYALVIQFVFIVPFLGVIELWATIDSWSGNLNAGIALGIISTIIAVQGLFMLWRSTKEILHRYRPTTKFITVKLIVLIATIQRRIISGFVAKAHASTEEYDQDALAEIWQSFLLALESPFFAWAMASAFTSEELVAHHDDFTASTQE